MGLIHPWTDPSIVIFDKDISKTLKEIPDECKRRSEIYCTKFEFLSLLIPVKLTDIVSLGGHTIYERNAARLGICE